MLRKEALTKEAEAEAKTSVWWDMDSRPIPSGYDAGRIREGMERALEKIGCSGPMTMITCSGNLKETPEHVLRALSSTKIILIHSSNGFRTLFTDFLFWAYSNPPPATMMFITNRGNVNGAYGPLYTMQKRGYNIVIQYDLINLLEYAKEDSGSSEIRRRQFILDKCSEPSESSEPSKPPRFSCELCNFPTQSLESFTTHLSGEEHAHREFKTSVDRASLDSHHKTATNRVMKKQPKTNNRVGQASMVMKKQPKTLVEANKVKKSLKKKKKKLIKNMRIAE